MKVTTDEFVEKWKRRMKGATEDIRRGVEKVTEAPSKKAVEKQEKMLKNLIEAIQSGRWAGELEKYGLDDWKRDIVRKGIPRISAGVDEATDKMAEFADWLGKRLDEIKRKVDAMPDETLEDNINRMVTQIREMAKEKYKGKRH